MLALLLLFEPAHAAPSKVKISTLNLKWYGIGGFMWNDAEDEFRRENIKKFIDQVLHDSEIIVFTEIVETDDLKALMQDRMECVTYEGEWSRHQHVVACYDKDKFRAEKFDSDFIISEAALGSGGLRPALQVKICEKTGECFLQVLGVHLAAKNKTEKRAEQLKTVNENLKRQTKRLPTVIAGDFNSYIKEQTGGEKDDMEIFEEVLSEDLVPFRSVTKHIPTYNSGEHGRAYDHIVVSQGISVHRVWGYEACAKEPNLEKKFIPYGSYRRYYTDHCPVTAEIEL
jgi:hypothetical protein